MPNIGPMELIVVLVIALVVLGPKRLPGLGKQLGNGMREFKDGISGIGKDDDDDEDRRAIEPASEADAPTAKDEAPAPKTEAPAPKTEAPAPKTEAPAPKTEAPAPKTETPVEEPAPKTSA